MKILFLLAFLPLCISNQDHQELQENLKLVIIDDQVKKDIIFQVKSELKEELSDILTEEFSQRLFGVFSRITNATASQAKNELKSEIKEELIEELTTELIFESDQSRIMNGPIVERDDCKAVKFLSLNRLQFDMVYENNKDCYAEIRFEREIDLKLSILNFFSWDFSPRREGDRFLGDRFEIFEGPMGDKRLLARYEGPKPRIVLHEWTGKNVILRWKTLEHCRYNRPCDSMTAFVDF